MLAGFSTLILFFATLSAAEPRALYHLEARPSELLLRAAEAPVATLLLHDGEAAAFEPTFFSTAGEVVDVRRQDGLWYAELRPPAEHYPQVAVVFAVRGVPGASGSLPLVAAASVAYSAAIDLKGRGEAQATVTVDVAGHNFGPVSAAADGRFVVPIVVPPGVGYANGSSVDRAGNRSRGRINLYLPEVKRLHAFVYPRAAVADGDDGVWLFVASVAASGKPDGQEVAVRAAQGRVGERVDVAPGLCAFRYTSPKGLAPLAAARRDSLTIDGRRRADRVTVEVELLAGAPATLAPQGTIALLAADGEAVQNVELVARDSAGNGASGHLVEAALEGPGKQQRSVAVKEVGDGRYVAAVPATQSAGRAVLRVRLLPRSSSCRRPGWRPVGGGGGAQVIDASGVPCAGSYQWYDGGAALAAPRSAPDGQVALPEAVAAQHRLLWQRGDGSRAPVPRLALESQLPQVEPLALRLPLRWHPLLPVQIDLVVQAPDRDGPIVRVQTRGVAEPHERLRLDVVGGQVRDVVAVGGDALRVRLRVDGSAKDPSVVARLMVTDPLSGVSAWVVLP